MARDAPCIAAVRPFVTTNHALRVLFAIAPGAIMLFSRSIFTAAAIAVAALSGVAPVQADASGTVVVSSPEFDVWVYPPGSGIFSPFAPTFSAPFGTEDPNRLGYAFYGFDLQNQLPADTDSFVLTELVFTVRLLNSSTFDPNDGVLYDPTPDPLSSFTGGPDTTPGRPMELYAVEYMNGFDYASWRASNAPVGFGGVYNAQPIDLGDDGSTRNLLNNVDDGIEAIPFAVGTTTQIYSGPGGTTRISDGATLTFVVDLTRPGVEAFWRSELAANRFGIIISSMHAAGFDVFGGDEIYPRLGTMETFGNYDATVTIGYGPASTPCVGDLNADSVVNADDLSVLLAAFGAGDAGDLNNDGVTNADDLSILLSAFGSTCD
jgi:hypothetical protein